MSRTSSPGTTNHEHDNVSASDRIVERYRRKLGKRARFRHLSSSPTTLRVYEENVPKSLLAGRLITTVFAHFLRHEPGTERLAARPAGQRLAVEDVRPGFPADVFGLRPGRDIDRHVRAGGAQERGAHATGIAGRARPPGTQQPSQMNPDTIKEVCMKSRSNRDSLRDITYATTAASARTPTGTITRFG